MIVHGLLLCQMEVRLTGAERYPTMKAAEAATCQEQMRII